MTLALTAVLISAASLALSLWTFAVTRREKQRHRQDEQHYQRHLLGQILRCASVRLLNPPPSGFDYAPVPDFGIGNINEAVARKGCCRRRWRPKCVQPETCC